MTFQTRAVRRALAGPVAGVALLVAGCGAARPEIPPGSVGADQFLYERGLEAVEERRWADARDYFTRIIDGYPASPHRADAKLAIGDVYLEQGTAESLILAEAEFRDFLAYYPTGARADYAQYKLGMTHYGGMRAPGRDQTETRAAIRDFTAFIQRYPDSALRPEVEAKLRESRDRLSESNFRVGLHYYRTRWYPGAIPRFREVLRDDPEFSGRDQVYFYLAESLLKTENTASKAEALPYYERIVAEFDQSEYLDDARERIAELQREQVSSR
jgi:outer membrane protein assembly factor BamD